jgi:methionine-rich copper-binding protein CopC/putative copper export protein
MALTLSLLAYASSMLLFQLPRASASAYVIGSDPVDGSTVATAPREVHVYFNAAISVLSNAHVLVVQQGPQNSSLVEVGANTGVIAGSNPNELIIPLKTSPPQGSYLVRWVAVANDDGRTTFGSIGFNVGVSSTGVTGTPVLGPGTSNNLDDIRALDTGHATNILAVVWEWVMIAALTLLIGILVMEQFVMSDGARCTELHVHTKKRANSLQRLCLAALFFSEIVSLVLRSTSLVENAYVRSSYLSTLQGLLINTNYGHFWLARFGLILLAMGLLYWTNRSAAGQGPIRKGTPLRPGKNSFNIGIIGSALPAPGGTGRGTRFALSLRAVLAYCKRALRTGTVRPTTSQAEEASAHRTVQTIPPETTPMRVRTGPVGTASCTCPVTADTPSSPGISKESRHPIAWLSISGLILLMLVLSRAPAQTFQPHISAILFDWLNLAALGIWFGCFVYLGYLILPLFNNKELEYHTETLTTVLQRLTPFLLTAISIAIVSTLFLSVSAISQPLQLLNDPYGRTLLIQIVLLVVMLNLSLYVLLWLHPTLKHQVLLLPLVHIDLPVRRLRQSALYQTKKSLGVLSIMITWLGVGMLLCMALMTFFSPPIHFPAISYSNPSTGSASTANAQTRQIGNLSVSLQLLPGRTGEANTVILLINDSNGKPVTDAQVRLAINMRMMDMGTKSALISGASPGTTDGNPVYITTFDKDATFNMAGLWVITVEIQQPNQNAVQGTFQVMLS